MLEISAHSPVHLLIVDPLGRRLGYDPRTDTWWNEIPDAGYETGSIASSDGSTLPEMKILLIPHPIDGQYDVQVIGYDTGSYEIIIHKSDLWGNITQESFLGETQDNSVDNVTIEFTINEIYLPIIIHDN